MNNYIAFKKQTTTYELECAKKYSHIWSITLIGNVIAFVIVGFLAYKFPNPVTLISLGSIITSIFFCYTNFYENKLDYEYKLLLLTRLEELDIK